MTLSRRMPGLLLLPVSIFLPGFILGLRFLYYFAIGQGQGKIQSVILAAFLMGVGFLLLVIGIVTDLISVNRKLLEQANARLFEIEDLINRQTH